MNRKPSSLGKKAEKAFQTAVSRVLEENRRLGLPVAVMKNGKAVLISVEEAMADAKKKRGKYTLQ